MAHAYHVHRINCDKEPRYDTNARFGQTFLTCQCDECHFMEVIV